MLKKMHFFAFFKNRLVYLQNRIFGWSKKTTSYQATFLYGFEHFFCDFLAIFWWFPDPEPWSAPKIKNLTPIQNTLAKILFFAGKKCALLAVYPWYTCIFH